MLQKQKERVGCNHMRLGAAAALLQRNLVPCRSAEGSFKSRSLEIQSETC